MAKKTYNGVTYDTDTDYTLLIREAAGRGDNAASALYEQQRNAKIAGEGLSYAQTNDYAAYLPKQTSSTGSTGASGAVATGPDFMALINEAVAAGDLAAAARYEQRRNKKIAAQGLDYAPTDQYSDYLPENRYAFDPGGDADYSAARARMDAAYRALTAGDGFSYDPETDEAYQAYAARYLSGGRAAMEDTLGRAAALTGGYASTYAESTAQQAYESYLSRLNDVLPELYSAAYKRYRDAQSDKADAYERARAETDTAYDRAYAQWQTRLKLSREDEEITAARYASDAQTAYEAAQSEASSAAKSAETKKTNLGSMIYKTGYTPTDAELTAAGMTRAEAEAWKQAYLRGLK